MSNKQPANDISIAKQIVILGEQLEALYTERFRNSMHLDLLEFRDSTRPEEFEEIDGKKKKKALPPSPEVDATRHALSVTLGMIKILEPRMEVLKSKNQAGELVTHPNGAE